jgi:hypothetical protein
MPVIPGFGVNYKSLQANWPADIAYFKSIKSPGTQFGIRPHLLSMPTAWTAGSPAASGLINDIYAYWRLCAQTFYNDGNFWVTFGPGNPQGIGNFAMTQNLWSQYTTSILQECAYLVANGIQFSTFTLGNELAAKRYNSISSLTQTGGTATLTTTPASPHNLVNGQTATISGTTPSGYSGTFTITVVNATTITYPVSSSLASPATPTGSFNSGAPKYGLIYDMSLVQYAANVQSLAASVKAVPGWTMPVSIDEFNYPDVITGQKIYDLYIANGLGNLDLISIHPYANISLSTSSYVIGGFGDVAEMMTAFGNRCFVTEFNVDAAVPNLFGTTHTDAALWMSNLVNTYLVGNNVPRFMLYTYVGYENGDNQLAALNKDGTFNKFWWSFFTSQQQYYNNVYK